MSLFSGPSAFASLEMFDVNTSTADFLFKIYNQYPVISRLKTFFGGPPTVMVHSIDLLKKMFIQNAEYFSNRPKLGWLTEHLTKGKGTVFHYFFT